MKHREGQEERGEQTGQPAANPRGDHVIHRIVAVPNATTMPARHQM
jgi:hypothetical protein